MNLLRRKPWIPVLVAFLAFVGLWIWFAWFAIQHNPEAIPLPRPSPTH